MKSTIDLVTKTAPLMHCPDALNSDLPMAKTKSRNR